MLAAGARAQETSCYGGIDRGFRCQWPAEFSTQPLAILFNGLIGMRILLGLVLGFALLALGLYIGTGLDPFSTPGAELPGPLTGEGKNRVEGADVGLQQGKSLDRNPVPGLGVERSASSRQEAAKDIHWRVVDAQGGAPLLGVRALDYDSSALLAVSDAQGFLRLRNWRPQGTVFYADGVWARTLTEAELRLVESAKPGAELPLPVYVDRYTQPVEFRFSAGDVDFSGRRVQLMLTRRSGEVRHPRDFPALRIGEGRRIAPELRRAWVQHLHLAEALPLRVRYLAQFELPIDFEDASRCTLRFAHGGNFEFRALSSGGESYVGQLQAQVGRNTRELVIPMYPAARLRLMIRDPKGDPVAGAVVTAQHSRDQRRPTRHARSDAAGAARILGLFPGESLRVTVQSDGFEVKQLQMAPGTGPQRIVLQPLPQMTHRIQILSRGVAAPIQGARICIGDPSKPVSEAKTDAKGYAQIILQRDASRVLTVRCNGYMGWRELVHTSGAVLPARIELIPMGREAQLKAGLITIVHGQVKDALGRPLAGTRVHLVLPSLPFGKPGARDARNILDGQQVPERLLVQTDAKGYFELISSRHGSAHLQHWGTPPGRKPVQLILGRRILVNFGAR